MGKTETKENIGIIAKLWKAYDYFPYLQKDKRNNFHKYSYLSEAKIKSVAHMMIKELGLIFRYSIEEIKTDFVTLGEDKSGVYVTVRAYYEFIDKDTGEKINGFTYGSGWDATDKALYKAITGSIKYIFNSTFLIPTGDDPENDELYGEQYEPELDVKPVKVTKSSVKETKEVTKSTTKETKATPKSVEQKDIYEEILEKELNAKEIANNHSSIEYMEKIKGSDIEKYAIKLVNAFSLEELREAWLNLPVTAKTRLATLKDIRKRELSEPMVE